MHVNAIGANRRDTREVDEEAVRCAELIAIDTIEQGQIEAGDLILPVSRGQLRWDWIRELGSIVAGTVSGRSSEEDITLFKSLGIALEDIAVGAFVFERAREAGVGTEIPL